MKICTKCKQNKEFSEFGKDRTHKDGYKSMCRDCRKEGSHDYYVKNKPQIAARRKVYAIEYRSKNKETISQKNKIYYLKNTKKITERNNNYTKNNPDKRRAVRAKHGASKLQATPPWLTKEQNREIGTYYTLAVTLTQITGVKYEVDHIIPLQGKNVRGLHVPWNLQVITKTENARKHNKVIP